MQHSCSSFTTKPDVLILRKMSCVIFFVHQTSNKLHCVQNIAFCGRSSLHCQYLLSQEKPCRYFPPTHEPLNRKEKQVTRHGKLLVGCKSTIIDHSICTLSQQNDCFSLSTKGLLMACPDHLTSIVVDQWFLTFSLPRVP